MALQDIINAIVAQADRNIAGARQEHEKRVAAKRAAHEATLRSLKEQTSLQLAQRKEQLRAKTITHTEIDRRSRIVEAKQHVLDAVFASALGSLATLPEGKTEAFLRACLKKISEHGTLHPSKKHADILKRIAPSEQFKMAEPIDASGGFRFVGKKTDIDFTFEHLVHHVLRPMKELDVAHSLFGNS